MEIVSLDFERPVHLDKALLLFDRAIEQAVFALIEAPPRHGKSETVFHAIARALRFNPTLRIAYVTYSDSLAKRKSRRVRELAAKSGLWVGEIKTEKSQFDPAQSVSFWQTREGGCFVAGGRGGGFTGEGFDIIIFDDPYKNRLEAESKTIRDQVWDLWAGTLRGRLEPGGSVFIIHQRWHKDDVIGRIKRLLIEDPDMPPWYVVTYEAVNDNGQALWPKRYNLEALARLRKEVGEYNWVSQYQQRPRARGGVVFNAPARYTELPTKGFHVGYGLDLAYTKKTSADWSISVEMWREDRGTQDPLFYVIDVKRKQVKTPEFLGLLKAQQERRSAAFRFYCSGIERGSADFAIAGGVPIQIIVTNKDKLQRSEPLSVAWNDGRVLLPVKAAWLKEYLEVMENFTGVETGEHDDDVDATAGAYDLLNTASDEPLIGIPSQRR